MTGDGRRAVEVLAPAKINLCLEVRARRADGYHDLVTWMMALDFGDRLHLALDPDSAADGPVALTLEGAFASPDVPRDERNLALRALRAARERAIELGCARAGAALRARLEKNIPSQSGLGGASSDACAALEAVEQLFDIDLGAGWRRSLLAGLGSDCVFFEEARNHPVARCEGRGERITARVAVVPPWFVAVVTPAARCSTAEVFAGLEFPLSAPPQMPIVQDDMFTASARDARRLCFNHLESAAVKQSPEVARWRSILDDAVDDRFVLSGSGSSFFGLFDARGEALAALDRIRTEARERGTKLRGHWVARARRHD